MLRIRMICVGAPSEEYWRAAAAEYKKRLSGMCVFEELRLREVRVGKSGHAPSEAEIKDALDMEAIAIMSAVPKRALLVSLCVEGKRYTSPGLSELIERAASEGRSDICFVIGSSYGLSDKVKEASDVRLSMSDLTFPHQLASVMLMEAIYRALDIARGGKYHK